MLDFKFWSKKSSNLNLISGGHVRNDGTVSDFRTFDLVPNLQFRPSQNDIKLFFLCHSLIREKAACTFWTFFVSSLHYRPSLVFEGKARCHTRLG